MDTKNSDEVRKNQRKSSVIVVSIALFIFFIIGVFFILPPRSYDKEIEEAQSHVPEHIDQYARQYIEMIKSGDVEQAYSMVVPELSKTISTSTIEYTRGYLEYTTDEMEITGVEIAKSGGSDEARNDYLVTYEIQNDKPTDPLLKYIVVGIGISETGGSLQVWDFSVIGTEKSLRER